MDPKGEGKDFYAVLGLRKDCSSADLKSAYKKLALKWHPDRCSANKDPKFVEEAKRKFQSIQEAYSVLSVPDKRFLYDFGIYDANEDNEGMTEFLNEMVDMMSQNKPNESFEELQELFVDMFQEDLVNSSNAPSTIDSFTTWEEDPLLWSCDPSVFDIPSPGSSSLYSTPSSCKCYPRVSTKPKKRCSNVAAQKVSYFDFSGYSELFDSVTPTYLEIGGNTASQTDDCGNLRRNKRQKISSSYGVKS